MGPAGVIGIVIWLFLGMGGVWLLVTGRKMLFGLPRDFREGWPVRVFGLAYVVMAALVGYGGYRASQGLPVQGGIDLFGLGAIAFSALLVVLSVLGHRRTAGRPG